MARSEKFTPGPWEARKSGTLRAHVVSIITDEHGRRVTRFVCECNGSAFPNDANAQLIAAAPDLLRMLQSMLTCVEAVGECLGDMDGARAAIAKALGERPSSGGKTE